MISTSWFNTLKQWSNFSKSRGRSIATRDQQRLGNRTRLRLEPLEDRLLLALLTVNTLDDDNVADAFLSLSEAVSLVNYAGDSNAALGRALQGGESNQINITNAFGASDTIVFDSSIAGGTIELSSSSTNFSGPNAFVVNVAMMIDGGSSGMTLTGGNDGFNLTSRRAFAVTSTGELSLARLTIEHFAIVGTNGGDGASGGGGGAALGGAIFNEGSLRLDGVTMNDNYAIGGSGGYGATGNLGGGGGGGLNGAGGTSTNFIGAGGGGGTSAAAPGDNGFNGAAGAGGGGGGHGGGTGGHGGFGGGGGGAGGGFAAQGGNGGFGGGGGGSSSGSGSTSGGSAGFGGGEGGDSSTNDGGGGAGLGGAIFNNGGAVTIVNSTLAYNIAFGGDGAEYGYGLGGAIFSRNGIVDLNFTTVSLNEAEEGRGVFLLGDGNGNHATAIINDSIIAQDCTCVSDIESEEINGAAALDISGLNNIVSLAATYANFTATYAAPELGELRNNGGPTETMRPAATSLAIDGAASPVNPPSFDQRGYVRLVGSAYDIGAVESANSTFTVNSTDDTVQTDSVLTLREAIAIINNPSLYNSLSVQEQALIDGTLGDFHEVQFDVSIAGADINLATVGDNTFGPSALAVSREVMIVGNSTSGMTISRDVNAAATRLRLFYVTPTGSLTLKNVTLSDGLARGGNGQSGGGGAAGLGGAIVNAGYLHLIASTLSNNTASGGNGSNTFSIFSPTGGGLSSNGTANGGGPNGATSGSAAGFGGGGQGSTNNNAGFGGGGAGNGGTGGFGGGAGGGNTGQGVGGFGGGDANGAGGGGAGLGGAIFNYGGKLDITNSTIANNTAMGGTGGNSGRGYGAGVFNLNGWVDIVNSTFAYNSADDGGALYNLGTANVATQSGPTLENSTASVISENSIFATSYSGSVSNLIDDFETDTASGDGNIFGTIDITGGVNLLQTGFDQFGNSLTADPLFAGGASTAAGRLRDYGGPTMTVALLPDSPAIDNGNDLVSYNLPLTDQRGVARVFNGYLDIGAFEVQGYTLTPGSTVGQTTLTNSAFSNPLVVTLTEDGFDKAIGGATISFDASTVGGATATFSTPAVTDLNGQTSVTATANNSTGTYTASATVGSGAFAALANFTLINGTIEVSLSLVGSPIAENGSVATVRATLSMISSQTVTIDLGFAGSATNGVDYSRSAIQVVISAGQTSGSITLTAFEDSAIENNETIVVDVTNVTNGVENGTQQVVATIVDNDTFVQPTLRSLRIASTSGSDDLLIQFISGNQFYVLVNGAGRVFNNSDYDAIEFDGAGGSDQVQLNALPGTGIFSITPSSISVDTMTIDMTLTNVETGYIFGTAADSATFVGSSGNDTFYGLAGYSAMTAPGSSYMQVTGVGTIEANSTAGTDTALFYDGTGNDTVELRLSQTTQTTATSVVIAKNFSSVYAFAVSGGSDTAFYTDSSGNETFYSLPGYSVMLGSGYLIETIGYESTSIDSAAGDLDVAILIDSTGDDTVSMSPTSTSMTGVGTNVDIDGFEQVYAFSLSGGNDTVTMIDSSGNDTFYGSLAYSGMVGVGFFIQANGFKTVEANASVGYDIASLVNDNGNETLTASGDTLGLDYASGAHIGVTAFDAVYAIGNGVGTKTKNITAPLAFDLVFQGSWA